MKLEQRVQVLEQEVQLLKNQIQATLLAIQEHLLVNTHPTLRADEPPVQAAPARTQTIRPAVAEEAEMVEQRERPATSAMVRKVSFEDAAPTPAPFNPVLEEAPAINVRKVQLDDLRPIAAPAWQQPATLPINNYEEASWNEDVWQTVSSPIIPNEPSRPTFQITPFINSEAEPTTAPFVTKTNWQELHELEEWASQKVEQIGVKRTKKLISNYARQGRLTVEEKETLLKFVSVYGNERRTKAHTSNPRPVIVAKQANSTNGRFADNAEEPRQNLILRLIAGVQSAGAADRSKRHG